MSGQIVQVSLGGRHPYAYVWDGGKPLAIGDQVMVPGPPSRVPGRDRGTMIVRVVALGSDYPGPLEAIIERVEPSWAR